MTACPSKALSAVPIYSFKVPRSLRYDPLTNCKTYCPVLFEIKVFKMIFSYLLTVLAVVAYTEGYSSGAPESACKDMVPRHPVDPQKHPAPYIITTSTKVVKAGSSMQVTISGKSPKDTIRGLMLQARAGDKIVGVFQVDPQDELATTMKCDVSGDTVTHKKHDPKNDKQTVTFTWTAPADLNDNIKFRATIALNGAVFWVGVESAQIKVSQ